MQRILNDPDSIVNESLEGFLRCHSDIVTTTENPRAIRSLFMKEGKVGVVTGGAMAATGADLDEVIRVAEKAVDMTRSIGIGLTPCTLPAVGHPNFEIKPGTMEVGVGPHGEPGMAVLPIETAEGMAKRMVDVVLKDLPFAGGDEVSLLVNGMGATPLNEQYLLYKEVARLLDAEGLHVYKSYVGNYLTSMDMMGASITLRKLDDELKQMLDMPCCSAGLKQR